MTRVKIKGAEIVLYTKLQIYRNKEFINLAK